MKVVSTLGEIDNIRSAVYILCMYELYQFRKRHQGGGERGTKNLNIQNDIGVIRLLLLQKVICRWLLITHSIIPSIIMLCN
jgi:hypothetical protein